MNKVKINELYERAHVVHEIPYEASEVDPSIVAVHKQRVFDRYLFAELIWEEAYQQGHDAGWEEAILKERG